MMLKRDHTILEGEEYAQTKLRYTLQLFTGSPRCDEPLLNLKNPVVREVQGKA